MSRTSEALMGEIAGPVVLLLQALDVLEFVARHLHLLSLDALLPFRGRLESAAQAT